MWPHPWDSPGKNTGVGCHFLLQCKKVKCESEVVQSCLTVCDPLTAAYQAPPSMGFSRQEYWSGVPLSSPLVRLVLANSHFSYLIVQESKWYRSSWSTQWNLHFILSIEVSFTFRIFFLWIYFFLNLCILLKYEVYSTCSVSSWFGYSYKHILFWNYFQL